MTMKYQRVEAPPPKGRPAPPDPVTRKTKSRLFAQFLMDHPNEWYIYPSSHDMTANMAYSTAHNIKMAKTSSFEPAGSFEAAARSGDDNKFHVYVRYVGIRLF